MMKPDWIVLWADTAANGGLKIHVKNLNFREDDPGRYCDWTINHYSVNDERYDWSRCDWGHGAKARFEALRWRSSWYSP